MIFNGSIPRTHTHGAVKIRTMNEWNLKFIFPGLSFINAVMQHKSCDVAWVEKSFSGKAAFRSFFSELLLDLNVYREITGK